VNRSFVAVATGVLLTAGLLLAQNSPPKPKSSSSASAARGKNVFGEKCAVCHNADSTEKKIGPGLKGMSKRTAFTISGKKITDESLKDWIENGDTLMPPFKDTLTSEQIRDVVAYVKTL
jgi:cytochrome c